LRSGVERRDNGLTHTRVSSRRMLINFVTRVSPRCIMSGLRQVVEKGDLDLKTLAIKKEMHASPSARRVKRPRATPAPSQCGGFDTGGGHRRGGRGWPTAPQS